MALTAFLLHDTSTGETAVRNRGLICGLLQASLVVIATSIGLGSATPVSRWSALDRVSVPAVQALSPELQRHPSSADAGSLAPELEFEARLGSTAPRSNVSALRSALLAERFHSRTVCPSAGVQTARECSRE